MKYYPLRWLASLLFLIACTSNTQQSFRQVEAGTIINLFDAFGKDTTLTKDFGFSCITRYGDQTILFDAGSNADIFRDNINQLRIDPTDIDIVVVSHSHFDHLNGLDYLLQVNPKVKIYFPRDIFWGAPVPFDATGQEPAVADSLPPHMQYFDGQTTKFTIQQSGRFWNANMEFIDSSKEVLPGLWLIATNSPYMGYFSCYPGKSFVEGEFEMPAAACKNTGLPELSMSIKTNTGQVLVVGCSHTGIESIVKETQQTIPEPIELVYGGFHMIPFDRVQTQQLASLLKNEFKVQRVAPAHCTGHLAFKTLKALYTNDYVYAGLGETVTY